MTRPPGLPCPVCGRPAAGGGPAPCPSCGLPAVGEAALVVARIGATLDELTRDRDRLLATLRAAAPGTAPVPPPAPPAWAAAPPAAWAAPPPAPAAWAAPPSAPAAWPAPPAAPPEPGWPAWPLDGVAEPEPAPPRRLSPQQVLLGLGALLLVAGAVAFVAVAWNRLGVAGQSAVLLAVTAALCATSAWTARRGLRATEEALAAAGAALLAVDLAAAHALGLGGADELPSRLWAALSCGVVAGVALALGRLTRSTTAWPLIALLAAQPVPLLLLPAGAGDGPAAVAVLLGLAGADLLVVGRLRSSLRPVALGLAAVGAFGAAVLGITVAWERPAAASWTATGLLLAAGAVALLLRRLPGPASALPGSAAVAGVAAGVGGLALPGSLDTVGPEGPVLAAALGLALLTAAVLVARVPAALAGTAAGGGAAAVCGGLLLLAADRPGPLALLVLAAAVPAGLAAVRLAPVRAAAVGAALAAPVAAVLLAAEGDVFGRAAAGLLLALTGALAFGIAAARAGRPEEPVAAVAGAVAGVLAGLTTASAGAWGQVAVQLTVAGAAAAAYGLVAGRRPVAVLAVADLVVASWIALGGAGVEVVEAYTLPAAAGLLLVGLPGLRTGAGSWAAEGAAVGVALLPSALVAVSDPAPLRLVLVVAAAGAATVAGALAHRQAPFVLGAGSLLWVVLGRLGPYAPLLPRWITLGTVGLALLVVGATYERRRQQAREAVAWVSQMR
ncbi:MULTISPECIES: SCO7613 C-terminal domain-containing membrane protein [unclassified Blastococcus]